MGTRLHSRVARLLVAGLIVTSVVGPADAAAMPGTGAAAETQPAAARIVRIAYLHHSTGQNIWDGGVPAFITRWNKKYGTRYRITSITYPDTAGGYPWDNYPYDYWNLWVNHKGSKTDRGELNLNQLAATYDVIVFKHCFPVSDVLADSAATPSVSSPVRTIANYKLQYRALRTRMRAFPKVKFILWTPPALTRASTTEARAKRATSFTRWVKNSWDVTGDNIFLWDFRKLETDGGLYLKAAYAASAGDSHPNARFSRRVAPLLGRRIVDVIRGRGDTRSRTGE